MPEPIVFAVDDDPDILAALGGALERRFGGEYLIMTDVSPAAALDRIAEACDGGAEVALVLSTSLEWLANVHDVCPGASRCADLASRAQEQAISLGAEFIITRRVAGLEPRGAGRRVVLEEGTEVLARTVVIATGVAYNLLDCDGMAALVGKGVFYGAATAEAPAFAGRDVFVVGAGNSAGQAAVHLSRYAGTVTLIVRGGALTMSDYLVKQIERTPSIHIRLDTQLIRAEGTRRLEAVHVFNAVTGESERFHGAAVFVFIGAGPHTTWLEKALQRDAHGHILTGRHVVRGEAGTPRWPEVREPFTLETSLPGVFAAGDVRHRSPRGVAAAVADGALAIRSVFEYLGE